MNAQQMMLAHAKINLSLQVGEKKSIRENIILKTSRISCRARKKRKQPCETLHEIASSIAFLQLHDCLLIEQRQRGGIVLEVNEDAVCGASTTPSGNENLILKAARALERAIKATQSKNIAQEITKEITQGITKDIGNASAINHSLHLRILLQKKIPAAAGLGGGSSDAATFLLYTKKILAERGVNLAQKTWLDVCRAVGSDIALFFLRRESNHAFVSGVGDIVEQREALPIYGVVILYGPGLATREVYQRYAIENAGDKVVDIPSPNGQRRAREQIPTLTNMDNDLQQIACKIDAGIGKRLEALRACRGVFCARMTGSGAGCFGLTRLGQQEAIAAKLREKGFNAVLATQFLATQSLDSTG